MLQYFTNVIRNEQLPKHEQRRIEREQAEAEEAEAARRQAAIAAAQARERANRETRERLDREARRRQREREIADLRLRTARQEAWQRNVERAARNAVVQQRQQAVIAALERTINPPPPRPESEREIIYVEAEPGLAIPSCTVGSEKLPCRLTWPGHWQTSREAGG